MGAMRTLSLQIGMISAQVAMNKATNDHSSISFNRLHKTCLGPTGQKVVCKACLDLKTNAPLELADSDITSGYEHTKGQWVEITDAERNSVAVPSNGAILCDEMVPLGELTKNQMLLAGSVYYLSPSNKDKAAPQNFATIRAGLMARGYAAKGKTCMYNREHVVVVIPTQYGLAMYMLRNEDEIRPEASLNLPDVPPKYLGLMGQILDGLAVQTLTTNSTDAMEAALKTIIDNKLAGITPAAAPALPVVQRTENLEDQMRKMLEQINTKAKTAVAAAAAEPAKEPAKPAKAAAKKGKKGRAA